MLSGRLATRNAQGTTIFMSSAQLSAAILPACFFWSSVIMFLLQRLMLQLTCPIDLALLAGPVLVPLGPMVVPSAEVATPKGAALDVGRHDGCEDADCGDNLCGPMVVIATQ